MGLLASGDGLSTEFWRALRNTLFLTVYGTVWALLVPILGAYALSKRRLLFRRFFNFFLVFTIRSTSPRASTSAA